MSVRRAGTLGATPLAALCTLLLFVGSAGAQQAPQPTASPAQLYVTVLAKSGTPLKGATVDVSTLSGTSGRSTNSEGLARFSDLPPGAATVQVQLNGWSPAGKRITLSAGKRTDLALTLEPHEAPERPEAPESPGPSSTTTPRPTAPER